jgi:hypothetical protein
MMRALLLAVATLVAGIVGAELPDIQTIKQEADRAWHADVRLWADYAFKREVTRQSFDADGNTKSRQDMRFRVTPSGEGFDEVLIEIDGREPTSGEVAEQRRKAIFTKHYRQAEKLNLENPLGEDLALLPIIQAQEHRLVGEDAVNGVACYRTKFDAGREPPKGASVLEKLKYAIKGSACFSTEGYHLVEFEMETVRSLKKGAITMNYLHMTIEARPVDDGWFPKTVELRSDVVVLGKKLRKSNTWQYTDFRLKSNN